jgi:hypothetical protein
MMLAVIVAWAVFLRPKFPAIREKYRREQEQNQERQSSAALSQVGNVVLLDPKDAISAPLMEQQYGAEAGDMAAM